MKKNFILSALVALVPAIYFPPAFADQTEKQPMQMAQKPVLKNAQDFIEFFRRGGEYYDRQYLPNLMTDNRPDPHALKVLGEALLTDNDDVRDRIVRLLQEVAYLDYPAYELRTPEIIDLLIGPGFAKLDGARSDAMDLLRGRASTATLSRYGDVFLKALKEDPGGSVLLLIAKAKPEGAREEVDRLSQLPRWKDNESMRIARAAFGDTSIEDEFIAGAKQKEDAGDGIGLGEALNPLVRIGTQRSLQAVCLRMRSPLIIHRPGVQQESVRLRVMSALIYAFPEEYDLLKPSSVWEDTDYIRVEKFCTQKTGVRYDGIPRPEFFTTLPDVRAE